MQLSPRISEEARSSEPVQKCSRRTSEESAKLNAPVVEPSAALRLRTGTLQAASTRRSFHCRIVKAGLVRAAGGHPSNIEITPHALQTAWDAGLFNSKAVFIDHAALLEYPSLENLVGVTQASTWNEEEGSIEGTIKLYSNSPGTSIAVVNLLTPPLTNSSQNPTCPT